MGGMAAKVVEREVKVDAADGGKVMASLRSLWWHASTGRKANVGRVTNAPSCTQGLREAGRLASMSLSLSCHSFCEAVVELASDNQDMLLLCCIYCVEHRTARKEKTHETCNYITY